jgi:sugar O-acyltransferase (sialic acid O-acetyltransferase NeuD family)
MENIAIYGAGGLGRETACLIRAINDVEIRWNIIGFFDDGLDKGSSNPYGEILGGIEELNGWSEPLSILMAIGTPSIIERIIQQITNHNIHFPNIIAPDVLFLDRESFSLGHGNLIGFRSILSCNVRLGDFNLCNSGVVIGHDTSIGNFNMFNPATMISGEITIGDANFFGICSIVLQRKKIGNYTTIATNSVIMRDTQDNCIYIGNPAVKVKNMNSNT